MIYISYTVINQRLQRSLGVELYSTSLSVHSGLYSAWRKPRLVNNTHASNTRGLHGRMNNDVELSLIILLIA